MPPSVSESKMPDGMQDSHDVRFYRDFPGPRPRTPREQALHAIRTAGDPGLRGIRIRYAADRGLVTRFDGIPELMED